MAAQAQRKLEPDTPPPEGVPPTYAKRLTVVEGTEQGVRLVNFREIWEYRELAFLLCWRDVKLKYAQTVMGFFWTLFQPLFATGVFTIIFGKLAKMESDGFPYALFSLMGMIPWTLFSNIISRGSESLVTNAYILSRVYFPRVLLPVGSMLPAILDYLVGMFAVVGMLLFFGYIPPLSVLFWFPIVSVVLIMQGLGMSLLISAFNVRYRDFGNTLPVALQLGMWVSPIAYPLSVIPEKYLIYAQLNPMAGVIEGFRSAWTGRPVDLSLLAVSMGFALLVMGAGLYVFRRAEATFADIA